MLKLYTDSDCSGRMIGSGGQLLSRTLAVTFKSQNVLFKVGAHTT